MKICLAGTGAMGEIHVKALAKIEGVEVVSVAGAHRRRARRSSRRSGIFRFASTNLEACIDRPGVDAVILTTPSDQHHDQTLHGARRRASTSRSRSRWRSTWPTRSTCCDAAKKAGKVLMVTHTRRFSSPHREIRRRIQEGTFHLHHMVVETYFFRRTNLNMHGQPRSWVDNLLWHHGCHSVDLAHWVLDEPNWDVLGPEGTGSPGAAASRWTSRVGDEVEARARSSRWRCRSTTRGPFGGFYRYIGEEETYKVYRDSMTDSDGKDVPLDDDRRLRPPGRRVRRRHPRGPRAGIERRQRRADDGAAGQDRQGDERRHA